MISYLFSSVWFIDGKDNVIPEREYSLESESKLIPQNLELLLSPSTCCLFFHPSKRLSSMPSLLPCELDSTRCTWRRRIGRRRTRHRVVADYVSANGAQGGGGLDRSAQGLHAGWRRTRRHARTCLQVGENAGRAPKRGADGWGSTRCGARPGTGQGSEVAVVGAYVLRRRRS